MRLTNPLLFFNAAGWPFMAIAAGITLLTVFVGSAFWFFITLILTVWVFYFFRDPDRVTPVRAGLLVSPADGRVVAIKEVVPEAEFGLGDTPRTRISIFLNVFNVHVNRMVADATVIKRLYRPGKFVNASLDKASVDNERMALTVKLSGKNPKAGELMTVVQIAGLIARRIVCHVNEGDALKAGGRFGIIRFGSRTDIYLPVGVQPLVCIGQTMIGGETVLADCAGSEEQRKGEVHE